jgi:hypothetical protein
MMLCLADVITAMKWNIVYEPPVMLFAKVAVLARVMITSIDLGIGTGKEKLISHLTNYSTAKLQQGELEGMMLSLINDNFSNNEIDKSRQKLLTFMKIIGQLFDALSKQELPDERERITFVKSDEKPRVREEERPRVKDDDDRPRVYKK